MTFFARGLALAVLALGLAAAPVAAQQLIPTPPIPPAPTGAAQQSLNNAYQALLRAQRTDPAVAQQANFAYQMALSRFAAGDVAGALSNAAISNAIAGGAGLHINPVQPLANAQPPAYAQPGAALNTVPATGLTLNAPLPPELLAARNEIDLATDVGCGSLVEAKRHYRAALDAYFDGDTARVRKEARCALDLAAHSVEKGSSRPNKTVCR